MGAPRTLRYADLPARHGIICDVRDDGVTITLPETARSCMAECTDSRMQLWALLFYLVRKLRGKPAPLPRMIIHLDRNELRFTTRVRDVLGFRMVDDSCPRNEVGEVRKNRYSKGLLVRIPGRANYDILTDLPDDVLQWLGETLTAALERTAPGD